MYCALHLCTHIETPWREDDGREPVHLLPGSDLFAAYQHTLSHDYQTVLVRWAAGDFRAGDQKVNAVESPMERDQADEAAGRQQHCLHLHPQLLHTRYQLNRGVVEGASEEQMTDVD